ncbi:MAG: TraR/DksA C4-type zinc finger protein [Opitutales bacterium]|nr:TraR/DksA C4-type zinc finger protein [Opitutales bacterium]
MATAKKTLKKPTAKKPQPKKAAKKPAQKKLPAKAAASKGKAQRPMPKKAAKPAKPAAKKPSAKTPEKSKKVATKNSKINSAKKPAPKKASAKKPAPKKAPAPKKSAKAPAKKTQLKKAAPAAKKPAKAQAKAPAKAASKKPLPAKPKSAKPAAKKPAPQKAGKPAAKKIEAKKPAAQKPAAKKPADKKPEAVSAAKKADSQKGKTAASEKSSGGAKKHTLSVAEAIAEILKHKKPKQQAPRVQAAEAVAAAAEPARRACAGIYFSMDDLESFLATRDSAKPDDGGEDSAAVSAKKKTAKVSAVRAAQVPKRAFAAASIADILGFNPIEESRTVFEEKDVPAKWKKYYKLLVEMKNRIQSGSGDKVESVSDAAMQLSHENSTQGMDAADIGSKNFERDMAFNLLSNEQNIISEVNAAIERIRSGTYGVCEITGKPIPESRLMAVPFTRCTIEGQKQKEAEMRRIKAGQRQQQYGVDLDSDTPEADISDDISE